MKILCVGGHCNRSRKGYIVSEAGPLPDFDLPGKYVERYSYNEHSMFATQFEFGAPSFPPSEPRRDQSGFPHVKLFL